LGTLLKCAIGIHVLYCFYALAQEYLATHTFQREVFRYPLFLVASTHTGATLFALCALTVQGVPKYTSSIRYTSLPAAANFIATTFQHWSLYNILFPTQTLMKCMKVVPVMVIGRFLKNRTYTWLDYIEGIIITAFVSYFVADFQLVHSLTVGKSGSVMLGIVLMFGYLVADSFTSPLEDWIYQRHKMDPGQMLLGMELISASFAWIGLLISGDLMPALQFIYDNPSILGPLLELTVAAAAGAYTCTITVRLYGPAVFVLLMMSRQSLSLVISVLAFKHDVNIRSCLCLVVVSLVVLMSSLRRVVTQLNAQNKEEEKANAISAATKSMPSLSAGDKLLSEDCLDKLGTSSEDMKAATDKSDAAREVLDKSEEEEARAVSAARAAYVPRFLASQGKDTKK
jgi:adenosine 3'-phospho 5'-phosphosulfate transporter B2